MAQVAAIYQLEEKRAEYMGSPQVEDGFTKIANELFDALLKFDFSGRQLKVAMAIIRKTYGYNKASDELSISQIVEITGISKGNVSQSINSLAEMNIVVKTDGKHANCLSINKHYMEWSAVPKSGTKCSQIGNPAVPKSGTFEFPNREPQKTNPKERSKRNSMSGKPDFAAEVIDYLNTVAGTKFRNVKANLSLIASRAKEGATLEQMKAVIDRKSADWPAGDKMRQYLRPATLFNATNFDQYLGSLAVTSAKTFSIFDHMGGDK